MPTINPLISSDEFVGLEGLTHLCSGGEAPWLKRQTKVYDEFCRLKSDSYRGRDRLFEHLEACRRKVGQLWGVDSQRISFMPSAAEGMSWLARGLDWQAGDNIVTTNLEFPSVAYAWKNLPEQGVEIRLVPHRDWRISEQDLLSAVDDRTRVLAVSQASFYTGQNLDIQALAKGLAGSEALLAVDATHASGVIDVPAAVRATNGCWRPTAQHRAISAKKPSISPGQRPSAGATSTCGLLRAQNVLFRLQNSRCLKNWNRATLRWPSLCFWRNRSICCWTWALNGSKNTHGIFRS